MYLYLSFLTWCTRDLVEITHYLQTGLYLTHLTCVLAIA